MSSTPTGAAYGIAADFGSSPGLEAHERANHACGCMNLTTARSLSAATT